MSPDTRKHRGPHPSDEDLFARTHLDTLTQAAEDYCHLLSRSYPPRASLKLVGDRFGLRARQRDALRRVSCSNAALADRASRMVPRAGIAGRTLLVDGFNVLITLEAALAGGLVLRSRDGALRDLASIHGTYRSVEETEPAIALVATELSDLRPAAVQWLLDRPVSNSGKLAALIRSYAERHTLNWTVTVDFNPDLILSGSSHIVATSDSAILDTKCHWLDLTARIVRDRVPDAWSICLFDESEP